PGVAAALRAVSRAVTVVLSDDGSPSVTLLVDGERQASAEGVRLPSGLDLGEARTPPLLGELGRRMRGVVFPGEVGTALDTLLDGLDTATVADVRIVAPDPVVALPFEAALLPGGRAPVLVPAVRMWRTLAGVDAQPPPPAPGPLKILVAVGAPDEGQTPNVPLDIEAEMGSILDAVDTAVREGRAQVRILEVAHPATIRQALAEDDYHVLHVSGHGSADGIELEDEDGRAVAVSAADLAACLHDSGKVVPLVVVSSCAGGGSVRGLAFHLHRLGVSRVVAMQAPVTDRYATELATVLYRELSTPPWPRAGVALAAARREVETARQQDPAAAGRPEWAVPTLLLTGEDAPLVDSDLPQVSLRRPPVHAVDGPVPVVRVRDLIGRRAQLRTTLRAVRGDRRFGADHGDVAGVALTGIGGVGKSTIAGRAMARLSEDGWVCSATQGVWSLEEVCRALQVDLAASDSAWAQQLRVGLHAADDDRSRLDLLERALRQHRLALVFDNFEDNLTSDGRAWLHEATAAVFGGLVDACHVGKLVVTCRYPIPGLIHALHQVPVGPLSVAETRRLFWRLDGLRRLDREDVALVGSLIGGHPRVLELLDALLRRGASVGRVRPKLHALARAEGIDPSEDRDVAAAVSDAVRLGARDIVLDELLDALDEEERAVLLQVAVSSLPVPSEDLAGALTEARIPAETVEGAAGRLADLSLLVRAEGGLWVHRWTAEALRQHQSDDDYRRRCRQAGELRVRRIRSASRDAAEWVEATENFLAADCFDDAADVAVTVADFLARTSTLGLLSFARRVRLALPAGHSAYKNVADHEAQALLALGFTGAAVERYAELVRDHQRLAEAEPDRADLQRGLSVCYERLADLAVASGQGGQACGLYAQSLQIVQRLAEAEPDRADLQRGLSVCYERLADLAVASGQGGQARGLYAQSLQIVQRLAEAEPDRADLQRGLSVSYNRLAAYFAGTGDLPTALRYFAADLEIARRLFELQPESAEAAVDVATSLEQIARVEPDPEPRLAEARMILERLRSEGQLPPRWEALLARLTGGDES
ncbi:MAG: CHAT domain-containing protein, partial [Egibacteraceae bacterium]